MESIREQQKQYREANKDKIRERKKEYRENNRERIKEKKKRYYEANKERIIEQTKQQRNADKERLKEYSSQIIACSCGVDVSRSNLSRHMRTIKHNHLLSTKQDNTEKN